MVPLMHGRVRPSPEARAAVLEVIRAAAAYLPDREASHLDRLFALECAARSGTVGNSFADALREAQRQAEWWLDDTWEPDVPHAAVLAQALSARAALGQEVPDGWAERLDEVLTALARRGRTRYGLTGDPSLLAAMLRGLAAIAVTPPDSLLAAAQEVVEGRRGVTAQAELADALARHRSSEELANRAAASVFNGAGDGDSDAPYARWWLVTRERDTAKPPAVDPQVVDAARRQAIALAKPSGAHSAAMLLEAACLAADQLVIESVDEVRDIRARLTRMERLRLAFFQSAFLILVCVFVLVELHDVAGFFKDRFGVHDEMVVRRVIAGSSVFLIFVALGRFRAAAGMAFDRTPPDWLPTVEQFAGLVAGIIAAAAL